MGMQENKNVKCLINKVWQPRVRFRLVTTKGFHFRSTDWTVITVDLPNNLVDVTIYHMELDSEYFVFVDTAHTPLEIEVAPMTIKGNITCLILLAFCPQPPFYLVKEQILAQAIPVPKEITVDGKSPEVYWAEVVGEDKPSLVCNQTRGSDHLHVQGVFDTVTDETIVPRGSGRYIGNCNPWLAKFKV
ncbi:endogenous retrovirus group K member 25 Pro protein-like protein [Turdus rufiventris]|nr:endogenous retrovirus group K member 25 Pro protein-like protein [Turdus rufiventris]